MTTPDPALPVTEAAQARSDLRRQFDRLLDDRWPLAGPLLRAVDEYVTLLERDRAAAGLDVETLKRAMSKHEDEQPIVGDEPHGCDFGCATDIAAHYGRLVSVRSSLDHDADCPAREACTCGAQGIREWASRLPGDTNGC